MTEHVALPEKIEVRVIKITFAPKGFRPKTKFILTTHTDSKKVLKSTIRALPDYSSIKDWHDSFHILTK